MRCPKCAAEVPESDYVCGACGAYARSTSEDEPLVESSRLADSEVSFGHGLDPNSASIESLLALRVRKSARRWARWSMVLAALALLFPVLFGPMGLASGYVAWRLGERRLGTLGAALSAIGMVAGVVLATVALSVRGWE
ncbi:MAG: hypothetical protein C4318_07055 [Acidimicrobiia bacterium]